MSERERESQGARGRCAEREAEEDREEAEIVCSLFSGRDDISMDCKLDN